MVRISPSASLEVVRDEVVFGFGSNSASGSRLARERAGLAAGFAAGWALVAGSIFAAGCVLAAGWVFADDCALAVGCVLAAGCVLATGCGLAAGWVFVAASGSLPAVNVSESGGTRKS